MRFGSCMGIGRLSRTYHSIFGTPSIGTRVSANAFFKIHFPFIRMPDYILDAGCGAGVYSLELGKRYYTNIAGIDYEEWVKYANFFKKRSDMLTQASVIFSQGDLTELSYDNKTFNVVMCINVIEHIEDDVKALEEMVRVLKNEGHLLISTSTSQGRYNEGHKRIGYSIEDLDSKMPQNMERIAYRYYGKTVYDAVLDFGERLGRFSKFFQFVSFPFLYPLVCIDEKLSDGNKIGREIAAVYKKVEE